MPARINVETTGAQQGKHGLTGEKLNPNWGSRAVMAHGHWGERPEPWWNEGTGRGRGGLSAVT